MVELTAMTRPDEIVGVIRGSEKCRLCRPANDPKSCKWFYVYVAEIARSCVLPENTMYIEAVNEKVNSSNPYPIPKHNDALIRSLVMPQYLNYTFTWCITCLMILFYHITMSMH